MIGAVQGKAHQMITVEMETNIEAININRVENNPSSEYDILILYPPEPFLPWGVPGEPPVGPLGGAPEGEGALTASTKNPILDKSSSNPPNLPSKIYTTASNPGE